MPRLELWLAVLSEDPTARLLSAAPRKLAAPLNVGMATCRVTTQVTFSRGRCR